MAESKVHNSEMAQPQYEQCAARNFLYIWEGPVRIIHWLNFFCILILSATGYYIHDPFLDASHHPYLMGDVRFLHYLFGVIFSISLLARIYWLFTGTYFSTWRAFPNPFNPKDRQTFWAFIRFYTFLGKDTPHILGHNPVAFLAYTFLFFLFALQLLSGFALWGQADPGSALAAVTGWVFGLVSNQWVRWFHFMVMFLIAGFFINHIYSVVLFDFKSKSGEVSSIFSGWKPDRR
ncbi:Ni/Fe-hydrogenase, b-type cytochrome subunit [Pelobacter seleniigenes]|uniref:Ni/Fe-hydrogenase, b-type cytochrome subunit n=1 Tax=Pelobacter seleniigenes TaxID=407188 RepID=UPI001B807FEF|nr:Ni/Fe-hydrogenase, b-type cytochrome subunit [Pelobacter seleniigenes]